MADENPLAAADIAAQKLGYQDSNEQIDLVEIRTLLIKVFLGEVTEGRYDNAYRAAVRTLGVIWEDLDVPITSLGWTDRVQDQSLESLTDIQIKDLLIPILRDNQDSYLFEILLHLPKSVLQGLNGPMAYDPSR